MTDLVSRLREIHWDDADAQADMRLAAEEIKRLSYAVAAWKARAEEMQAEVGRLEAELRLARSMKARGIA